MRNLLFTTIAVLAVAIAVGVSAQVGTAINTHLDTWQLVSFKYGDAKDFSEFPKAQRRMKLITDTHFT